MNRGKIHDEDKDSTERLAHVHLEALDRPEHHWLQPLQHLQATQVVHEVRVDLH